jgi:acetyl esterase/lipase
MVTFRDIAYVPDGDPAQVLDLVLPENSGGAPAPVIVLIHGGGWFAGKKTDVPGAEFFPPGCAIASVEYRLSQTALFPAQIQDCQAAVRWLRANSGKYNLDPARFGAWGASAGGHLAAMLGAAGGKGIAFRWRRARNWPRR